MKKNEKWALAWIVVAGLWFFIGETAVGIGCLILGKLYLMNDQ